MADIRPPAGGASGTARSRPVLTPQSEDFPRWYQDVVAKAEMAENGPARGTMIIKPWGYALWERVQRELDDRIKATGHDNAYFPLFIPMDFFEREAEHVEGFSPELAVVTHGGGKELAEPLAVRPTSETTIGDAMSRWIQGYRDLPLLLNQWANVVRWELRPRLFLRTSEFLWQEGHTAHATWDDAQAEVLRILHDVYYEVMHDVLAVPVLRGRKTDAEKFPGAEATYTLEGLMRDGKALQMGTSHHLGQNFSRAFDITFSDENGAQQHVWTTSWGVSARVVGGLVMAHGDDQGLRLPPRVAPVQAVVLAIKDEAVEPARRLVAELQAAGVRARTDERTNLSFGRRAVDWELKGVPVRLEVGPRDLAAGQATLVRRDLGEKQQVGLDGAARAVPALLDEIQDALLAEVRRRRDDTTKDVRGPDEVDGPGFFRLPWDDLGIEGEERLAERGYTVRALVTADGGVPEPDDIGLVAYVARAY
ncbi:MAG: proline--tRNA ligase [Egibacteraceae bacterium]